VLFLSFAYGIGGGCPSKKEKMNERGYLLFFYYVKNYNIYENK